MLICVSCPGKFTNHGLHLALTRMLSRSTKAFFLVRTIAYGKTKLAKTILISRHLIYIWFLKIIFSWAKVSEDYCLRLLIEISRLTPAGWGHYVVFLVKTLYSQSASLHPCVWMGTSKCWGQPCYGLACHSAAGSRNISSCFLLWKLG